MKLVYSEGLGDLEVGIEQITILDWDYDCHNSVE